MKVSLEVIKTALQAVGLRIGEHDYSIRVYDGEQFQGFLVMNLFDRSDVEKVVVMPGSKLCDQMGPWRSRWHIECRFITEIEYNHAMNYRPGIGRHLC